MSAFVVHKRHIDAIVTAGLNLRMACPLQWFVLAEPVDGLYQRGKSWGPSYADQLRARGRELTPETAGRVGAMLLSANRTSVNHRYDENAIEEPYVFEPYTKKLSPVQILKALKCYVYQSCEHPGWNDSEAKVFCTALQSHVIDRLDGYEESEWEITG